MHKTLYLPRLLNSAQELEAAAQTLTHAFDHDPLMSYIVPGSLNRARQLPGFFQGCLQYGCKNGTVYVATSDETNLTAATANPAIAGVALWLGPGAKVNMTTQRVIRAGLTVKMLKVIFKLGWANMMRLFRVSDHTEKMHTLQMTEPHWYLMFLGVETTLQGHGIGSKLLQPVLAKARSDGLPCYLETMNSQNVPFYQRHGFKLLETSVIPKGGPKMWPMLYSQI